ncbi:MAG: hypothetical protein A2Y77_17500, partial [Planctomycetes bacterium RBG_13_62_9]
RSEPVEGFHELVGVLFVVSAVVHLVLNWGCFVSYLSKPVSAVLGVVVVAIITSLFLGGGEEPPGRPPIMDIVHRIESAPLAHVAPLFGIETEAAAEHLRREGMSLSGDGQTIEDIAASNGKRPHEVLNVLSMSGRGLNE